MATVCPVCDTKILASDSKSCQQCGADLGVFTLVDSLEAKAKKINSSSSSLSISETGANRAIPSFKVMQSRTLIVLVSGLSVIAIVGVLISGYQFQNTLLMELQQERISRENSDSQNAKITEKLIEKNAEAYAAAIQSINTFSELNKGQQESIQKLNLKIDELEKELTRKQPLRKRGFK